MNFFTWLLLLAVGVGAYFGLGGLFKSGPIATGPGGGEIQNPQPVASGSSLFGFGQPAVKPAPKAGESPFKGKIKITEVERSSDQPEKEYVIIRYESSFFSDNKGAKPIDVTGWHIASFRESGVIPRAYTIPEIDAIDQDVFLPSGGEVVILSGMPTYALNFRENECVGYLNQTNSFTPSLSNSCPDSNPDTSALLRRGFRGACIDFIQNISSCRAPRIGFDQSSLGQDCIGYINDNFNYVGCVKNFRDKNDFLKNTWRVFLSRTQKLFDPRHDQVVLRDQNGLLVDEFDY